MEKMASARSHTRKKHEQAHKSPAQSHQIINSKHHRAIVHICIVGERTRWTRMMLCAYWVSVVCVCMLLSLAQGFRKWLSPHRANSRGARFSLAISVFQWLIHHLFISRCKKRARASLSPAPRSWDVWNLLPADRGWTYRRRAQHKGVCMQIALDDFISCGRKLKTFKSREVHI